MGKKVVFGTKARQSMKEGLDIIADAVKATLGPRGRHVAIETKFGAPLITKDGVTVARSITLSDRLPNMGANLVKAAAQATNQAAGDGTTTAVVLSQSIYTEGAKMAVAGHHPVWIKSGIDKAVEAVVARLKEISVPVQGDKVAQVATISANNDHALGSLIAEAVSAVGEYGMVSVEEAAGTDTRVDYTEGLKLDRGWQSIGFVTNLHRSSAEYEDAFVLCYGDRISDPRDLAHILNPVNESGKPILIIAKDYDEKVLNMLVYNKINAGFPVCAIKAPGYGDYRRLMMDDVSVLTGGKFFSNDDGRGLKDAKIEDLGVVRRVSCNQNYTYLIEGRGDVAARVQELQEQLKQSDTHDYQEEFLRERIAKLSGGVAIISVGGVSETEMRERKDRVEDSINAVRAAIDEGVVPGGGTALLHCIGALDEIDDSQFLDEEKIGVDIVRRALYAPFEQIMKNAGVQHYEFLPRIKESNGKGGYNALRGEYVEDMVESGIIDPVKVVRVALQNAASASGILLTTEVSVFEDEPPAEK